MRNVFAWISIAFYYCYPTICLITITIAINLVGLIDCHAQYSGVDFPLGNEVETRPPALDLAFYSLLLADQARCLV